MPALSTCLATTADIVPLQALIQRAYRGAASRAGWTHEADLIGEGERIDLAELHAMLADPAERLLVGWSGDRRIGCVRVATIDRDLAYLGLLCVDPPLQAAGHGKHLIDAAEDIARVTFGARRIEMTVIEQRRELIAFYRRRGYVLTGERRDFPIALDPPLFLVVLEKPLA
ncbi:GNAT family N-acetyltransferase [Sphingomonas bacterium]|uniref:GNAT family N-acetyltransferase n=1 Tax=Sphingomonas bacterium TaxID=1895847 RepID=UPI0015774851|nr:GNAT family N-acetyltransferase [Sphingomonas bacterium]